MKVGDTLTAKFNMLQWQPPLFAGTVLTIIEVKKMGKARHKDKFGKWETSGGNMRLKVSDPRGNVYWIDPENLGDPE